MCIRDRSGVKTPKMLFEDEGSSRIYVGDMWSPNDPLVFCVEVPGEARRCFYEVVVPYANIERENVAWCDRERYIEREREIEIFKISRTVSYTHLDVYKRQK